MTDIATLMLIVLAGCFGLLIGSHLNVVIHRVPRGESVVSPPSACPACGHHVRPYDNVPVLAWLWLRGKCRDCAAPISVRYPIVEALTGALFALVAWWALSSGGPGLVALPAYLYLSALGVALAFIDVDVHRLPDRLVLPSYAVLSVLLTVASAAGDDWEALGRAAIGGAGLGGFYLATALAYKGGMGLGDVKLAVPLGASLAWLGWGTFAVGVFLPFLVGGVVAVALLLTKRARRGDGVPFGPYMIAGTLTAWLVGRVMFEGYLELVGL